MDERERRRRERERQLIKIEGERRVYEGSLLKFAQAAWTVVEPQTPFEPNWHHELVCEYLTLALEGVERRIIINMPPQHTKSRLVTVLWPCWAWARKPGSAWIFSSYSADLSKLKHSAERKTVIDSDWYVQRWGRDVEIAPGQDRQDEYMNTARGFMVATSTGGTVVGKGADFLVVDDPMDPRQSRSDAEREGANLYFDQTLYTRQRDPRTSVFVIVMQRLHNADLTGHVLESKSDLPWKVVEIPAEAEKKTIITFPKTGKVVTRQVGALLWPERFGPKELASYKQTLGSWGYSAQFQQRAVPFGGGYFKRHWWHYWGGPCERPECDGITHGLPSTFDEMLQSWDCSFKDTKESDFVSGQVWGRRKADEFLLDRECKRMALPETLVAIKAMSRRWPKVTMKLVEDKANGPAVISTLQHQIAGLIAVEPQGGKEARAHAVTPLVEAGNVYVPHPLVHPWVDEYLNCLCSFPKGSYDDDVDATSQALIRLSGFFAGMGMYSVLENQIAEREEQQVTIQIDR